MSHNIQKRTLIEIILLISFWYSTKIFSQDNSYSITDERNSNIYPVVRIGDRWWMAKNLDIGDMIPASTESENNGIIEKYCLENDPANCDTFGGIYQWNELMQYGIEESSQGICPNGWHLPSDTEWKLMELSIGMSKVAADSVGWRGTDEGGKLKATGNEFWYEPNVGATNETGFNLLGSGARNNTGLTGSKRFMTDLWTSTNINDSMAWFRYFTNDESRIFRADGNKAFGTAARCIKNSRDLFDISTLTDTRDGHVYKTVKIGDQWWMAENLNYGNKITAGIQQTDNQLIEKYCYNNDENNCNLYGALYQWIEAMNYNPEDIQGICPDNWHVPTDEDWKLLEHRLGINALEIDNTGWTRGTNQGTFLMDEGGSGFDVLLGGAVTAGGSFDFQNLYEFFWNSTSLDENYAWTRIFGKDSSTISRNSNIKTNGVAVRCIQNVYTPIVAKIIAPETICRGDNIILRLEIHGGNGIYSFDWESATGVQVSTADTLLVTPEEDVIYYVTVNDGMSLANDSFAIKVNPQPVCTIEGPDQVCVFDSEKLYYTTNNTDYLYEWSSQNAAITSNANTYQVNVRWDTVPGIKTINLSVINNINNCHIEESLQVEILPSPPKPGILQKAHSEILICPDSGFIYQWFRNNVSIPDEYNYNQFLDTYYLPDRSGEFTVTTSLPNTCKQVSEPFNFPGKSVSGNGEAFWHHVFLSPNPCGEEVLVEITDQYLGRIDLQIYNALGELKRKIQFQKTSQYFIKEIDLLQLRNGIYFLLFNYGDVTETHKIIVSKK